MLKSHIHHFTHFLCLLQFALKHLLLINIFNQPIVWSFSLILSSILNYFQLLSVCHFQIIVIFSRTPNYLSKQNVLTRRPLKLDWFKNEQKTRICIASKQVSSILSFPSFIHWLFVDLNRQFSCSSVKEKYYAHAYQQFFLFLSLRFSFAHKNGVKSFSSRSIWKLKSARVHK